MCVVGEPNRRVSVPPYPQLIAMRSSNLSISPSPLPTLFLILLAGMALAAPDPVISWKAGDAQIEPHDARLAQLGRERFSLRVRLRLPAAATDATIAQWQTDDRKGGFRLFTKDAKSVPTLGFDAAFDWKHARNNRPLQLSVPLAALAADRSHEVIVRFTGPTLELFVDGVLVDEEWPVGAIAPADGQRLALDKNIETLAVWDRAIATEEIMAFSGGPAAVAQRGNEILGPERPVTQYWRPRGFNTWVGDCMPFYHEGRFHLFYLIDRHGHGSKWGLGAHQWAHVSSSDLVQWTHHPLAIPITDQAEGSICTGAAFAHDGFIHAFYAVRASDGSPARLTASRSKDGIHFEKSDWSTALTDPYSGPPARDPIVFRDPATNLFHMLVTTELTNAAVTKRGGCLAHLVSTDLRAWEQRGPYLVPGFADQPECADWFEWNGWHYLIFGNDGVARYRMSRAPHGPWLKPKFDVFDCPQVRVLKTAAFTGNRRLGAAFVTQAGGGYAGQLVMREIVQHADGTLGTAFPNEMQPATGVEADLALQPLTDGVTGDASRVQLQSPAGHGLAALDRMPANFRLRARVSPAPNTGAFGICVRGSGRYEKGHELRFEPDRGKVVWRNSDADTVEEHERSAMYGVEGLDRPFEIEVVVKDDLLDVCIAGRHTLIARAKPSFTGDRLFLFAQNGGVIFDNLVVEPLVETP